ncbi:MAG: ABC transporter ATP-binding protein [Anaerocolumna sp.]
METLLQIDGLNAWYQMGKNVLTDLSLILNQKEVVGLIGLNGAGKTTLIKILTGLHDSYTVDCIRLNKEDSRLRENAFKRYRYTVFSEDNSFQYFTFEEYLRHVFLSYKTNIDYKKVEQLCSGFQFEPYKKVLIKDLSTGNKKKVFLITGFALQPDLLILDEPVNGLDFQSTEFLYRLMRQYNTHGTLFFSSHILESICLTADRVIIMEHGSIGNIFNKGDIIPERIRGSLYLIRYLPERIDLGQVYLEEDWEDKLYEISGLKK